MITRVLGNAIWLGVGEVAVKGGLLAAAVLIARGAGASGVGTFSIAFGAAMVGIMVLAFGQQEVLIREVARTPEHARSLLTGSQALQFRLAKWLVPAAALGTLLIPDTSLRLTILSFVPYVLLRIQLVTRGAAFKGLDRMDVEVRARGLEVGVALLCIASATFMKWPIWTVGLGFSFGAATGLVWIDRKTREMQVGAARAGDSFALREGLSFMAIAVLGQLLVNTDRFLLAFFGIARAEIGYWGAAGTIVWALVAAPQLLTVALYPTFSRFAQRGDSWRRAGLASACGGVIIGLGFALALREIAAPLTHLLFGPDFAPAVSLMRRLALVLPGAFAMMIVGAVYAAWRRQLFAMWVLTAAFCTSLILNVAWIPVFGAMGSANAVVVVYSVAALLMTVSLTIPRLSKMGSP